METASKITDLYGRLAAERASIVRTMAEVEVLPPSGLITRLATLDGAIAAVEAVLKEENETPQAEPAQSAA